MSEVASILGAVASCLTAVAVLVATVRATRSAQTIRGAVAEVHREVKTINGLTLAALGDRAEGRRIESDVPASDRTTGEQEYVDRLYWPATAPPPHG